MTNRDDFTDATKRALELRANAACSFPGCPQITSGPSAESLERVNRTGVAAHIHGASSGRGSRRYLATMSSDERRHIRNAIWLCTTHADLIDGDETTYSADSLFKMKEEHEDKIFIIQRDRLARGQSVPDLIAVGETIFTGDLVRIAPDCWSVHVGFFVLGDLHSLVSLAEDLNKSLAMSRGLLVNALGDGRALNGPPTLTMENGAYILHCRVHPRASVISAIDLPTDLALGENHDLFVRNGDIATVSGLDALPQKINTVLSVQRGEMRFHPEFGARISEFYADFGDTAWFSRLLKLELIRHAALPNFDPVMKCASTPFQCVERVVQVETLAATSTKNWLPIRVTLDVKGVGRWSRDLSIYVSTPRLAHDSQTTE